MPTVNLTAQLTKRIKPTSRRIEYFDDSLPGFCLRVTESGHKGWGIYYRFAGRLQRMSLGNYPTISVKEARQKARDALHDVANRVNPATIRQQDRMADTFKTLASEYLERHSKIKKRSWHEDERIINRELLPYFGSMKAKEITRRDVRALLDRITPRAPIMANRVRALVRKMFNWGIVAEIVDDNPVLLVPMPAKNRERDRILTEDEIRKVWATLNRKDEKPKPQTKYKLITAASLKLRLITAQRGGEVQAMEWAELDLDNARWTIPGEKTKNGLTHRVPLSTSALRIIDEMKRLQNKRPSRYVFPSPKGDTHIENVQKAIQRIEKATGVDFRGHDLRRTAASLMTGAGIPRLVVGKILNHVEPGVTKVYDRHSYDKEKREALEQWSKRLQMIVSDLRAIEA